MGLHDRALQCYQELVQRSESNKREIISSHYGIGQILQLKGHYDQSLSYFEKVLELNSEFPSDDQMLPGLTHNYIGIACHYGHKIMIMYVH